MVKSLSAEVAGQFDLGGGIAGIEAYGGGKINDTFLVTLGTGERRLLQRLNPRVFPAPVQVMENLRIIAGHMARRLAPHQAEGERWEIPRLYRTWSGRDFVIDPHGGLWRVLAFIEGARARATVQGRDQAREAGAALGRFHGLLADLDPGLLHDTLPGFHITPGYLLRYEQVRAERGLLSPEARPLATFIADHGHVAALLAERQAAGRLKTRIMHGDPKLDNILLDDRTGRAIALIDLDTVKPGLIQYDLGDLLRSACNPAGGEAGDPGAVRFDTELYRAIMAGYLSRARSFVSPADLDAIPDSVLVIALELGLRYFTDYLEGNVYFKASTPDHNLKRARVQFRLVELIEAAMPQLHGIVDELR